MADPISLFDSTPVAPANGVQVKIFDPPMCCPTGLCGPTLDQVLLDVNEMLLTLQNEGVRVARYQMAADPQAFLRNAEVFRLIREREMEALPITVVNGQVIKSGEYPTLPEVRACLNSTNK